MSPYYKPLRLAGIHNTLLGPCFKSRYLKMRCRYYYGDDNGVNRLLLRVIVKDRHWNRLITLTRQVIIGQKFHPFRLGFMQLYIYFIYFI